MKRDAIRSITPDCIIAIPFRSRDQQRYTLDPDALLAKFTDPRVSARLDADVVIHELLGKFSRGVRRHPCRTIGFLV